MISRHDDELEPYACLNVLARAQIITKLCVKHLQSLVCRFNAFKYILVQSYQILTQNESSKAYVESYYARASSKFKKFCTFTSQHLTIMCKTYRHQKVFHLQTNYANVHRPDFYFQSQTFHVRRPQCRTVWQMPKFLQRQKKTH